VDPLLAVVLSVILFFFFQAEDGIRDFHVTGVQTCALPILIYQPLFIVAEALERGDLVELTLDQPTCTLGGIHVLYPPDRRPPAKVRVMIEYLLEMFAKSPMFALER